MSQRGERASDPDTSKFSKGQAGYTLDPGDRGFPRRARCRHCVHFVNQQRMCKVVEGDPGEIKPTAACRAFFSDVGIFADTAFTEEDDEVRFSQFLTRSGFDDWTREQKLDFLRTLVGRL